MTYIFRYPSTRPSGCGTVFKLTPPAKGQTAWAETVLYSFKGGSDGLNPQAGLIADNTGALYGTTSAYPGTVFKLTPPARGQTAWTETVLYNFCSLPNCSDGAEPNFVSLIADKEGALYGTTGSGGIGNYGTVFKLTPPAKGQTVWTETVLYSFKGGSDGQNPEASLIADDQGALYSTTFFGGTGGSFPRDPGSGTVFKLTPPAKGQTTWTKTSQLLHAVKL